MAKADVIEQAFVVVLELADTDFATVRHCLENQFGVERYNRVFPAGPDAAVVIYQGPDGQQLRVEGNRLVLQGAPWERESCRWATALEEFCAVMGIAIKASGINPVFAMDVESSAIPRLCRPGPLLEELLGEKIEVGSLKVRAPYRDKGLLHYELTFSKRDRLRLHAKANWHQEHASVQECVQRLRDYAKLVAELREHLEAAIKGEGDDG